jgi:diacylglycerol kinase (ATP)
VKVRFIYNPRSGHNSRNSYLLRRAQAFIATNKLNADITPTERPRHATDLAKQAVDEGCDLVVAVGGDGTMNEIATALIGTPATLGLVPCGSGNGLGRHLGIPGPGRDAFQTLLHGERRLIDTGLADGHPFFNAMGLGFDAEISDQFNRLSQRGLAAYCRTTLNAFFRFRPQSYTIRNDVESVETKAFIVTIANSDQYGNDCYIAPGAEVDDGHLDVTVLRTVDLFNAVPLAVRLFTKSIGGSPSVTRLRGPRFTIERPSPGLIHTDGETHLSGRIITVSVLPKSLRIMVPRPRSDARTPTAQDSAPRVAATQ